MMFLNCPAYLDQDRAGAGASTAGNPSGNSRYLIRVDCPMATPFFSPDAGMGEAGK